jgi:hypothetical protein
MPNAKDYTDQGVVVVDAKTRVFEWIELSVFAEICSLCQTGESSRKKRGIARTRIGL